MARERLASYGSPAFGAISPIRAPQPIGRLPARGDDTSRRREALPAGGSGEASPVDGRPARLGLAVVCAFVLAILVGPLWR